MASLRISTSKNLGDGRSWTHVSGAHSNAFCSQTVLPAALGKLQSTIRFKFALQTNFWQFLTREKIPSREKSAASLSRAVGSGGASSAICKTLCTRDKTLHQRQHTMCTRENTLRAPERTQCTREDCNAFTCLKQWRNAFSAPTPDSGKVCRR